MSATLDEQQATTPDTVDELLGESTPMVLDVSLLGEKQRTIQYLQHAGLLTGDDAVTTLNVAKRVNHAAYADERSGAVQALQSKFQDALERGGVEAVTEGGAHSAVAQLVDGYLAARVESNKKVVEELDALPSTLSPEEFNRTHHRATANIAKFEAERAYYAGNPEALNDVVRAHPESLEGGYKSLGTLAVETGAVQGDKEKARDMVDDTLAVGATHGLMHIAEEVMHTSDSDMELNARFPERYAANIIAKADDTAASTTPIDRASPAEEGTTPQLARIQALTALLSAQLHAMTKHTSDHQGKTDPEPAELAQNLMDAKQLVNEYRSAAMSLASHFLADGPAANDPRMQQLRENLNKMMDGNNIPRLMKREEAEAAANRLADDAAGFLISKSPGDAKAQAIIGALLAQAKPQPEQAQSMAERLTDGPSGSFAERAERSSTPDAVASR